MAMALMLQELSAENFSSGAAGAGEVLTADGAGGAAWAAPSGGGGVLLDTIWNTTNADLCIATEKNNANGDFSGTERQITHCGPGLCARGMLVSFPLGAITSIASAVLRLANSGGANLICSLYVEAASNAAAPAVSENLSGRNWTSVFYVSQSFVNGKMAIDITLPIADVLASVGSMTRVNVWLKAYAASGTHYAYMNEGAVPPALSIAAGVTA